MISVHSFVIAIKIDIGFETKESTFKTVLNLIDFLN